MASKYQVFWMAGDGTSAVRKTNGGLYIDTNHPDVRAIARSGLDVRQAVEKLVAATWRAL